MRAILISCLLSCLAGCAVGAATPVVIAGLSVTEYGQFKTEIRERAEACRASEEDLLPKSVEAISKNRADRIIEAYQTVYKGDFPREMKAQALYQIGLIQMNEYNEQRDDIKAMATFTRLKTEFSDSVLCADVDRQIATLQGRRERSATYSTDSLSALRNAVQRRAQSCVAEEAALLPESAQAIAKGTVDSAIAAYLNIADDANVPQLEREQALFQVGLMYMNSRNASQDDQRALYYFNLLKERFPDSLYCVDADARIAEIMGRSH
ncbi:MAG: tetratricopeptide repeat protein [Oceanospirillaceae bacterium]|nr:tetratricopeptide repeat protein [Oceanospirillaceae bacterium]MCP5335339.1 tetratricopeptide repeat protein [Oceanospirillaceae bacterium]MCP5350708.1 tetratricopeptide repeat protein [Oceanospirillaceae bacterium]